MKQLLTSIFTGKGEVSFKRVSSGLTLIVALVLAFVSTYTEHKTPEYIYNWLIMLVIAGYGGTVVENVFHKKFDAGEQGTTN